MPSIHHDCDAHWLSAAVICASSANFALFAEQVADHAPRLRTGLPSSRKDPKSCIRRCGSGVEGSGLLVTIRSYAQGPVSNRLSADGRRFAGPAGDSKRAVALSACPCTAGCSSCADGLGSNHVRSPQLSFCRESHRGRSGHHRAVSLHTAPDLRCGLPVCYSRGRRPCILEDILPVRCGLGGDCRPNGLRGAPSGAEVS